MKKKEALRTKIIKRFYGINGDYDEYKEREINKIGNNAFMILFWYILFSSFGISLFATDYPVEALWTYLGLNLFVTLFVICPYIIFSSRRHKLTEVDIEKKNLKQAKKKAILGGIYTGLFFAIGMHFLGGLIDVVTEHANFIQTILSFRTIIGSLISGIIFGGFMCMVSLQRFHKIDDHQKD